MVLVLMVNIIFIGWSFSWPGPFNDINHHDYKMIYVDLISG